MKRFSLPFITCHAFHNKEGEFAPEIEIEQIGFGASKIIFYLSCGHQLTVNVDSMEFKE